MRVFEVWTAPSCCGLALLSEPLEVHVYMYVHIPTKILLLLQGEKELQVSLFQGLVLLLFNDTDKLTFSHIKAATGIGEP